MRLKLLIFLILLPLVFASVEVPQESASVSHIVGDTPDELLKQLEPSTIDIFSYTYRDKSVPLGDVSDFISSTPGYAGMKVSWSHLKEVIFGWSSINPLLIVEGDGMISKGVPNIKSDYFSESDFSPVDSHSWTSKFSSHKPVAVLDANYAGVHLPKTDSFVKSLGQDSTIIAPSSVADPNFVTTLLCNLKSKTSLGDLFRKARNNYYLGQSAPSGLALMSYTLFGNPLSSIVGHGLSSAAIKDYCGSLTEEYSSSNFDGFDIQDSGDNFFTRTRTIVLDDYEIVSNDNYSVLDIVGFRQNLQLAEPVVPVKVFVEEFPIGTIINEYSFSLNDPVDFVMPLSDWFNTLVSSDCSKNASASVVFGHSNSESSEIITASVFPLEIIDCSSGSVRLYRSISYDVKYLPFSPVLITGVSHPDFGMPNEDISIDVGLQNLETSAGEGLIVLSLNAEPILVDPVVVTSDLYSYELTLPDEEGIHKYRVEFVVDDEPVAFNEFSIEVKTVDVSLVIPPSLIRSSPFLSIENYGDSVDAVLSYSVLDEGAVMINGSDELVIKSGSNVVDLQLDIPRIKDTYELFVSLSYGGRNKIITGIIVADNKPAILNDNLVLKVGDVVNLVPSVYDADGDFLRSAVLNPPFPLDGTYVLTEKDIGTYYISMMTGNDVVSTKKTIRLIVE